jgi:hypothetical protein
VTDREERLVAARSAMAVQQWPTLTEAFGCMDCLFLFRLAVKDACPLCESASILNVANFFNKRRNKARKNGAPTRQMSANNAAD